MGWNYHRSKDRMKERKKESKRERVKTLRWKEGRKRMTGEKTDDEI